MIVVLITVIVDGVHTMMKTEGTGDSAPATNWIAFKEFCPEEDVIMYVFDALLNVTASVTGVCRIGCNA